VTGRPRKDCDKFLHEHNIGHFFRATVCMEDGPPKVPPSVPFSSACLCRFVMYVLQSCLFLSCLFLGLSFCRVSLCLVLFFCLFCLSFSVCSFCLFFFVVVVSFCFFLIFVFVSNLLVDDDCCLSVFSSQAQSPLSWRRRSWAFLRSLASS
jgi:hypothetical protein